MLTHKEMTKHIRTCIKRHNIKALIRMQTICGDKIIQVNATEYGKEFTEQEQRDIREIATHNNLTWVKGLEIDTEQMTNPFDFNFYYKVV